MTRGVRRIFFLVSALLLGCVFWLGFSELPAVGKVRESYGDAVNAIVVSQQHVTDAVTAVNFDIRGFDTLGEEFILFTSVMGVVLLLRRKDEPSSDHEDKAPGRQVPPSSDAVRVTSLLLLPATVLFGVYIVSHGQLTPGGGFQGGVVLSTAPLLLYLTANFGQFKRVTPGGMMAIAESVGAATYILAGGAGVALGGLFLQNVLPLGKVGSLTSGGIIPIIDLGVGLEVSGGIVLVLLHYLEELLEEKER